VTVALAALSLACALQAVVIAVLAGSVPYLWHRTFKAEAKVEELDEVVASLCEAAGLPSARAAGLPTARAVVKKGNNP
jgi:hypothetical protein